MCAIINAVCAALMDAGVMTTDMITSCSAGELENEGRRENEGVSEWEIGEIEWLCGRGRESVCERGVVE